MGRWRIEQGPYGAQERWIPQFRGEWPAVPEPPCPVCGGELVRRTTYPQAGQIAFHRKRLESMYAAAVAKGFDPAPLPPAAEPVAITHYIRSCYRGPHGFTKPEPGERRGGPPTELSLSPALVTGDWNGPRLVDDR